MRNSNERDLESGAEWKRKRKEEEEGGQQVGNLSGCIRKVKAGARPICLVKKREGKRESKQERKRERETCKKELGAATAVMRTGR